MNKIKQEKGVTLLILAIIVIALMILAGVMINMGAYDVDSTVDSKLEGELRMVQYAVFQQYAKYKTTLNEEECIIGTDYSDQVENFMSENYPSKSLVHSISTEDEKYKKYYILNPELLIKIGIQDSEYSYIVNYYTGEVMNADKYTTSTGDPLYIKGTNSPESSEIIL